MFDLPTIFDLVSQLAFMRGMPAAYLVLATAVIVVVIWDWRVALAALTAQYLVTGLLFVERLDPRLSVIEVLVGLFICLMLYFTARQVNWGRPPADMLPEELAAWQPERRVTLGPLTLTAGLPRRLLLAGLMTAAILWAAGRPAYQLPEVADPAMNLAILALGGLGLLGLAVTTEPLKAGMGLLMFVTGFELYYFGLEQSVALLVFLAASNLILTLAISYLTQVRHGRGGLGGWETG